MYDIIIIGGGAAGMSAAIYASRGGMKTLVIEKIAYGGQALKTPEIDNYPGFYGAPSGEELSAAMKKHAEKFGAEFTSENVKSVEVGAGGVKIVKTRKNEYTARVIIFACGAKPKTLGVDGEERFTGAGVSYCAFCDGAFFKGKDVVVIGGGNTAFEDALYLANFCNNVFILNRSKRFRAQNILVEKAKANPKITIYTDMVTEKIDGETTVERVYSKNTATGERGFIKADGVFVAIGVEPESALAKACGVETCGLGFIKTNMYLRTNIEGIYAAGDVRVTPLRQVVTAASDGAVAAASAINYLNGTE
ncbi:MAG: thioredoxin-disulfide reductase [Firmicutes bacterium]|nr:thioredoxin-disulfide reductase [Bacillota bacterium]